MLLNVVVGVRPVPIVGQLNHQSNRRRTLLAHDRELSLDDDPLSPDRFAHKKRGRPDLRSVTFGEHGMFAFGETEPRDDRNKKGASPSEGCAAPLEKIIVLCSHHPMFIRKTN